MIGAPNSLNLNCKVRVMKEAPGPSVSEEIADIFRNYDIDMKLNIVYWYWYAHQHDYQYTIYPNLDRHIKKIYFSSFRNFIFSKPIVYNLEENFGNILKPTCTCLEPDYLHCYRLSPCSGLLSVRINMRLSTCDLWWDRIQVCGTDHSGLISGRDTRVFS